MLAYPPTDTYDPDAELEYREDVRRKLQRTWQKNADVVIPFGYTLGFTGQDGSKAAFQYDAGTLSILIDDVTVVSFATDTALLALQAAYEAADATLSASITSEATTRATADTAIASSVTSLTATVSTVSGVADSKVKTFAQTTAPTATTIGDLWIDTDDSNKIYRATATGSGSWVAVDDARIATNTAAISTEATARADADTALASSITTLTATVNVKARTYRQTTAPTGTLVEGDLWYDTDDNNKVYRYTSSAWTAVDDSRIATAASDIVTLTASVSTNATAIATVDGKLTASYGIAVDAGGRIASLKLLSDGSTSSIEFLATTFKVYNGSSTETPFEISGGVVKIKTANVGVLTASNISVSNLSSLSADFGNMTAGAIDLTSGSYVVRHGAGFGASSDLVMWYGLASTARGSATKTNGVFALATDGKVYYGSRAVNAPITMTFSPTSVSYSAAGSGGHSDAITVTASGGTGSYTYQWFVSIQAMSGVSTLLISSGATSATCTVAGTFDSGGDISGRAYCVVTDSDGYQATGSLAVSYSSTS